MTSTTTTLPPPHDGPVLALAYCDGALFSAGADGRVLRFTPDLTVDAVLRDDPSDPVTALAAAGAALVTAGSKALRVVDRHGTALADAPLDAPTVALAVRATTIFVLGGGQLRRFERKPSGLVAGPSYAHGPGAPLDLDVDDAGTQALLLFDGNRIELVDLKKRKRLAEWSDRKAAISARFESEPGTLLVVDDRVGELKRVNATSGRSKGPVATLTSLVNGPMVFDEARASAAVRSTGEDVEILDLANARTRFFLQPELSPPSEVAAAALGRHPRLVELAPGFVVRKGSRPAPPPPTTQSALALDAGGLHAAAGYLTGEIVAADTTSARVVSSHRGTLASGRCRDVYFVDSDDIDGISADGREAWVLHTDGRVLVADLETLAFRDGPRLDLPSDGPKSTRSFYLDARHATLVASTFVARWDREDPSRRVVHALPPHVGAVLLRGELVTVPKDSVSHEGFDVATCDLETGAMRPRARFARDPARFPLGNDPKGWVRVAHAGDVATVTIWAGAGMTIGRTFAFDHDQGELLVPMPHTYDARGDRGVRVAGDVEKVVVFDLRTGETVDAVPLESEDACTGPAAYDATSRLTAAVLGSKVVVWRPDRPRLTLRGHREPNGLWLGASGRGLLVRDRGVLRLWDVSDG